MESRKGDSILGYWTGLKGFKWVLRHVVPRTTLASCKAIGIMGPSMEQGRRGGVQTGANLTLDYFYCICNSY